MHRVPQTRPAATLWVATANKDQTEDNVFFAGDNLEPLTKEAEGVVKAACLHVISSASDRPSRPRWRGALSGATAGLVSGVCLLAFTACSAAPRGTSEDNWMEYLKILRPLEAVGTTLEPGSDQERLAIERFQRLLSDFKAPDFRPRIRDVYADQVFFNDTLKTVHGVDEVEKYLVASAEAVEKGEVEFLDVIAKDGNYYFRWVMTIRFKRFARGEEKRSVGMSHVRFDREGKVVLHQDFWDSSGGLFEHVPVLGWMLRRAKKRL